MHEAYWKEAGGDEMLTRVGKLTSNSLQGHLIDKKTADATGIEHLEDLKDPAKAKLFDIDGNGKANLFGCEPGWGCERIIEHQLDAYGLRDTVEHKQGGYFAIIPDAIERIKAGEPTLYYTWTPLWLSAVLRPGKEVVWLNVEKTELPEGDTGNTIVPGLGNLGFPVNDQMVIANTAWLNENPAAMKLFELITIPIDDINAENKLVKDGENSNEQIMKHATDWIAAHQAEWDEWIARRRRPRPDGHPIVSKSTRRPEGNAMSTSAIDCRGLWKILGSREAEALAAARDRGVGKTETRDQYGRVVGVADVSFQVRPGEIFCVMGLSGSGKSTLVRHLNRLIEPTAGEVQIGGRDVNKLNAADLRAMRAKEVGMVFQNTALLPHRTVNDNVALSLELRGIGEKERHAVAAEKLALVDWSGWGDRYPDELSGGMKQRVGLARAMAALDLGPQAARATPDTKLDDLVTIACTTDAPIVIWDGDAQVGVITKTVLLRGIQGHEIAA